MAGKDSQGQADKKAAEERTEDVAKSAAAKSLQVDEEAAVNPYPNYDLMSVEDLQALADERGVEVNRDVLKAHLVTELRAADTHTS